MNSVVSLRNTHNNNNNNNRLVQYLLQRYPLERGRFFSRWSFSEMTNHYKRWRSRLSACTKSSTIKPHTMYLVALQTDSGIVYKVGCTTNVRRRMRKSFSATTATLLARFQLSRNRCYYARDLVRCISGQDQHKACFCVGVPVAMTGASKSVVWCFLWHGVYQKRRCVVSSQLSNQQSLLIDRDVCEDVQTNSDWKCCEFRDIV